MDPEGMKGGNIRKKDGWGCLLLYDYTWVEWDVEAAMKAGAEKECAGRWMNWLPAGRLERELVKKREGKVPLGVEAAQIIDASA